MVTEGGFVRFALPFNGFDKQPLPPDLPAYMAYRESMIKFISGRGQRMLAQTATV
jgi:hypothetical protein